MVLISHCFQKCWSAATEAESRGGISKAMMPLGEGDLLVVWKLDRVGRSIADLILLPRFFDDCGFECQIGTCLNCQSCVR
ncbi:recombinase family protein [Aliiroseovarius crassostreae]|uniref:Recombinase family protein n=1 Tax=Aliiroseovarius crassostreae TaxID=154981 RepID=A0A9Q9LW70_9RHOB|nr:recombinase family protein [Aliiroseovarius crassostreae]UWP96631.1 recombinase family protein [Aliiroseovarius crassostreae]